MPDRYQESHIRQIPLFSRLSEYHFQLVARAFKVGRYNPGDYMLIQGTEVPGLIIVADGQLLKIHVSPENAVTQQGSIDDGQAIYLNALFNPVYADTHLQAVRPTNILFLSRQAMSDLLAHHPDLGVALSQQGQAQPASKQKNIAVAQGSKSQFKGQRENEILLLYTRQHWFSLVRWIWAPVLLVIFGFILSAGVPQIAIFAIPLAFIVAISWGLYIVLEWANDSVVITDQRVIHTTRTILTFHELRNEVALSSIQEANAEIPRFDLFAHVLRYGDVEIRSAGAKGNFTLDRMPDPENLQDLILEAAKNFKVTQQTRERQTMIADIERWKDEPYQAKDAPMPQPGDKSNVANESNLKNIYTTGEGPVSPFVMTFPTNTGGIVYRKHWFIWLRMIALPSLWLFATLIGTIALLITPLSSLGLIGWIGVFVALLVGVVWFYLTDWDWRHDYYLITDNDITLINQRPLWLQNERDQVLLTRVDNVVAETKGFFQQMFKFGSVKIALIGADTHKEFNHIAKPDDVQNEITRRQRLMKQKEGEAESRARRDEIGEYLSLYHHSQPETDSTQVYPADLPLPHEPGGTQVAPVSNPTPSPFGHRPSISQGRPYTPSSQPPPSRPQSPYRPEQQANQQYQGGQQAQYPPQPGNQQYQGGQHAQYPLQQANQQYQGGQQQAQYPPQPGNQQYQGGQQAQYPPQQANQQYQGGQQQAAYPPQPGNQQIQGGQQQQAAYPPQPGNQQYQGGQQQTNQPGQQNPPQAPKRPPSAPPNRPPRFPPKKS